MQIKIFIFSNFKLEIYGKVKKPNDDLVRNMSKQNLANWLLVKEDHEIVNLKNPKM